MRRASRLSSRPTWTFTIQHKLLALILVPLFSIVAALVVYFPMQHLAALEGALEQRAGSYANILSEQVSSAVAFNDKETAREAFAAAAHDSAVSGLVLFTERGDVLYAHGAVSAAANAARHGVQRSHVFQLDGGILAVAPVRSLEGPKGTLAVELSTKEHELSRQQVRAHALAMGIGVLFIGMVAAFWSAASFARRLRALSAAAARVSDGDLAVDPVPVASNDEIGVLTIAFNAMVERLHALIDHITDSARVEQTRLEEMVQARTQELDNRNADMRLVLETMGQGFVTIDHDARMATERSAILETWLGAPSGTGTIWDYVAQSSPDLREYLVLGWYEVTAGVMPLELALAQMPSRFSASGRSFELDYRPIGREGDRFERMLVVVSDISARVEREHAEADQHELAALFAHLMRDRVGLLQFFAEARELVELLCAPKTVLDAQLRAAHTLKGNASLFGAHSVAAICHVLEEHLQARDGTVVEDKRALRERIALLAGKIDTVVGDHRADTIEIRAKEHRELLAAIDHGEEMIPVRAELASWALEPMVRRLERIRGQVLSMAERLGKGEVDVVVEHNNVRFDAERFADFWAAFGHAVRNAVDHGLESADERAERGKPLRSQIRLRTFASTTEQLVQIEDDGRGIDWEAVRKRALERGLPSVTREELVDALFRSGLSTRNVVTEMSGRGVGLHAVREACVALGGRVSVDSELGRFTRFTFRWPAIRPQTAPIMPPRQLSVAGGMQ
jgi:two-component system chemotaxis sensor kinase CheA